MKIIRYIEKRCINIFVWYFSNIDIFKTIYRKINVSMIFWKILPLLLVTLCRVPINFLRPLTNKFIFTFFFFFFLKLFRCKEYRLSWGFKRETVDLHIVFLSIYNNIMAKKKKIVNLLIYIKNYSLLN